MRKTLLNAVLLWLILTLNPFSSSAAESVTVIYVNGIQNTREDANDSGRKIIEILLASENHLNNKRDFDIVVG